MVHWGRYQRWREESIREDTLGTIPMVALPEEVLSET